MSCRRKRRFSGVTCTSRHGPDAFIRGNHHTVITVTALMTAPRESPAVWIACCMSADTVTNLGLEWRLSLVWWIWLKKYLQVARICHFGGKTHAKYAYSPASLHLCYGLASVCPKPSPQNMKWRSIMELINLTKCIWANDAKATVQTSPCVELEGDSRQRRTW